jgi:dolichol-phosphate mannosyltransferase
MRKLIIIPTYNECENIEAMVAKVFSLPGDFSLLVVDDGSPDGTADIVRRLQTAHPERLFIIERSGKLGLGTAYLTGFEWALREGFEAIYEMDCDFSHDPDDLLRLTAAIEEGADVAVGSRYVSGVNVVNWPMRRLLLSFCASRYVKCITRMPVRDATAGFVAYRAEVLRAIDFSKVKMKGYGFQIEMKYTAWRLGFNIKEVSIIFRDRTLGTSKMSSGIFGEAFWGVLGLRFRRFRASTSRG